MHPPGADVAQQVDVHAAAITTGTALGTETHGAGQGSARSAADGTSAGTATAAHGLSQNSIGGQACCLHNKAQWAAGAGADLNRSAGAAGAATAPFNRGGSEAVLRRRHGDTARHRAAALTTTAADRLGIEAEGHHAAGADAQHAVGGGTLHNHGSCRLPITAAAAHSHREAAADRAAVLRPRG